MSALANFIIARQFSRVKIRGVSNAVGFGAWHLALGIYVAGVLWALIAANTRPLERVTLAILWPLGPLAFVVTVTILLAALPVAFPKVGIPFWLVLAGAVWWVYSVGVSV
jgi:hypothetical protein